MSLSDLILKAIGVLLAVVGFCLVTGALGLPLLSVHLNPPILELLVGLLVLGAGVIVARGGAIVP